MNSATSSVPAPSPAVADRALPGTTMWVRDTLHAWSDTGLLRQLDSAFAAFIAKLDPAASPALLVAAAVLTRMEGRGHSCLPLTVLAEAQPEVLAWPADVRVPEPRRVANQFMRTCSTTCTTFAISL